jgi:hypothetical protein
MTNPAICKATDNTLNQTVYMPSAMKVAAPPTMKTKIQNMAFLLSLMVEP